MKVKFSALYIYIDLLAMKNRPEGFSLIELLVSVAIIGVLSSIAIPAFQNFKTKAYNTELRMALSDLTLALEDYYNVNNDYTSSIADLKSNHGLPNYKPHVQLSVNKTNSCPAYCAIAYGTKADIRYQFEHYAESMRDNELQKIPFIAQPGAFYLFACGVPCNEEIE